MLRAAPAIKLLCSEMMEARQAPSCSSEGCSAQDQLEMISCKQRSVTLDNKEIECVLVTLPVSSWSWCRPLEGGSPCCELVLWCCCLS